MSSLDLVLDILCLLPAAFLRLATIPLQTIHDLTGQVTRVDPHYFDYGGNADIWKGRWAQTNSRHTMEVLSHIHPTHQPFLKSGFVLTGGS
jgi:hypothetical protein